MPPLSAICTKCAVFKYAGGREIERVQTPYDLTRTQSWTDWREPDVLRDIERMHDEDAYERGEVYRYDLMGRMTKYWTNVALTADYTTTDPTSAGSYYDDLVEHAIGKVYERQSVTVTPDGGSADVANYYFDPTETSEIGYQYGEVDGTTLVWDDNGQLTDDGTWDYEWTALGQLHRAYGHATEADRTMTYDAFGRRVQRDVSGGGGSREYLYHGWHMIGESDGTDWLWMEVPMAWGEGMLEHIALDANDLDGDTNTTEYRQYAVHEDFQSTVWALSDVAGEIVERYVQDDPYGVSHTLDASDTDLGRYASEVYHRKRMHGGVTDAVLGLYDFRNRWLVPERGQWMSRDPLGAVDSWNLTQYALMAPTLVSDRFGASIGSDCDRMVRSPSLINMYLCCIEKVMAGTITPYADYCHERCAKENGCSWYPVFKGYVPIPVFPDDMDYKDQQRVDVPTGPYTPTIPVFVKVPFLRLVEYYELEWGCADQRGYDMCMSRCDPSLSKEMEFCHWVFIQMGGLATILDKVINPSTGSSSTSEPNASQN